MAFRSAGRLFRGALTTVGGITVGAGVLAYVSLRSSDSFRGYPPAFRRHSAKLPDQFILELDFEDLDLVEKSSPLNALNQALGRSRGQVEVRQVVKALQEAGDDERIRCVLALMGGTQQFTGLAQVQEIRQAMQTLRSKSQVPTVAYSDAFGEGGANDTIAYYLASSFGRICMMPSGLLSTTGLATSSVFVRQLLDRWHIEPLFLARGKYKNIINTFTEDDFTAEHREATEGILKGFTSQMVADIAADRGLSAEQMVADTAADRGLSAEQVTAAIDASPLMCPDAIKRGLITGSAYRDEVIDGLAMPLSEWTEDPTHPSTRTQQARVYPRVGIKRYIAHQEREKAKKAKADKKAPQVAVIMACGSIVRGKGTIGGLSDGEEVASVPMCNLLQKAREDDQIRSVVLRIDSPGGSAVASDAICREVKLLKDAGKPVIVSMGNIAASGGYYIAAPATKILAEGGTITGSVGVVFGKINLKRLLNDYGIRPEIIKEGENAGALSAFTGFTPEQGSTGDDATSVQRNGFLNDDDIQHEIINKGVHLEAQSGFTGFAPVLVKHMNGIIDWVYHGFVDIVATHRNIPREEVLKIAQGRVWTGADALSRGLVDQLGGLSDAIKLAKLEAGFSEEEAESIGVVDYPRPKSLAKTLMDRWSNMQANSGSQPTSLSVLLAAALASCGFSPQADPLLHAAKNIPGSAELLDGLQQAAGSNAGGAGPQLRADFNFSSR